MMVSNSDSGIIRDMLNLKLTLGQVLAGFGVTIMVTTSVLMWTNATFQSKADAREERERNERRFEKLESNAENQARVLNQIEINTSVIRTKVEALEIRGK